MSRLPKIGDLVRFRYDEVDLSRHATGLVINDGRDPTEPDDTPQPRLRILEIGGIDTITASIFRYSDEIEILNES